MVAGAEIVGMVVGAVLTIMVFGYLLGDVPFLGSLFRFAYRFALHLFLGALVGYTFSIVVRDVGVKMIVAPLLDNPLDAVVVPVIICVLLLLFKALGLMPGLRRFAFVGSLFVPYLVGVGAAVALIGAVVGTLFPQMMATGRALSPGRSDVLGLVKGLVIVGGTVCALLAFDFTLSARKRRGLAGVLGQGVGFLGKIGRWMLIFAFGVAFAGALTASLSIFIGRIQYLIVVLREIAGLLGF